MLRAHGVADNVDLVAHGIDELGLVATVHVELPEVLTHPVVDVPSLDLARVLLGVDDVDAAWADANLLDLRPGPKDAAIVQRPAPGAAGYQRRLQDAGRWAGASPRCPRPAVSVRSCSPC